MLTQAQSQSLGGAHIADDFLLTSVLRTLPKGPSKFYVFRFIRKRSLLIFGKILKVEFFGSALKKFNHILKSLEITRERRKIHSFDR